MRIAPDDAAFPSLRGVARGRWRRRWRHRRFYEGDRAQSRGGIEYTRRGGAYEAKGDRGSADTDYRKALQLDPEDETAKQRLEAFSK